MRNVLPICPTGKLRPWPGVGTRQHLDGIQAADWMRRSGSASVDTPMHAPPSWLRSRYTLRREWLPQRPRSPQSPEYRPPAQDSFTHHLQGPVQNENSRPLVDKVWRLWKQRQQNIAPNAGPSRLQVTAQHGAHEGCPHPAAAGKADQRLY